jgi:hypothetical protein
MKNYLLAKARVDASGEKLTELTQPIVFNFRRVSPYEVTPPNGPAVLPSSASFTKQLVM